MVVCEADLSINNTGSFQKVYESSPVGRFFLVEGAHLRPLRTVCRLQESLAYRAFRGNHVLPAAQFPGIGGIVSTS
jgi:hypothetical protein